MPVYMHVFVYAWLRVCMHNMHVYVCVCMYGCTYALVYVCGYVCAPGCLDVSTMYVLMYGCVDVNVPCRLGYV